jgi:hypothetical protein
MRIPNQLEILNKIDDKELKFLVKKGIIPTTLLFYQEIMNFYNDLIVQGKKKYEATLRTSHYFKVSVETIFKIRKKFEQ